MTARRLGDFGLYVLIGIALFSVIAWVGSVTRWSGNELGKWVALASNTLIVFGFTIRYYRRSFRRFSFWGVLGLLLLFHLIFFIRLMQRVERWPYSSTMIILPGETMLIMVLLLLLGFRPGIPGRKKTIHPPKLATRADLGHRNL